MRFGDLTYLEIKSLAQAGCPAIVPTGCTEQQGPHLPVDFDTWFAENLMGSVSERLAQDYGKNTVVLPATPYGPTPEHRGYGGGFIDLSQDIFEGLIYQILASLAEQGFSTILIWPGCGGHKLASVVESFDRQFSSRCVAHLLANPFHQIWCAVADPNVPGGHADSFTTSIAMYLRPESVRVDQIANPDHPPVDWGDPHLDFSRYSSTGVIGDPTHASPKLGETLWDESIQQVSATIAEIAAQ